ncbi:MAG: hypothetical protein IJO49_05075 [Clostridia bacterium]|nr:hypothetical protein [Clostridia bacterium]
MSVNIKIDLNSPVQTNFLGNNAVYHGFAGMPDSDGRVYSEELCEIEANRAKELGVRIVRTFYEWYAWDSKTQTWDWENDRSKALYKWLDRMKKRNIQVALNTGWWLPEDIVGARFRKNSPFALEDGWENQVKAYAKWVSESLYQLIELRGFDNITYIHLFTEPQRAARANMSATVFDKRGFELWRDCAKAVNEQLVADGRRHLVKIVGPNEGSTSTSVMNKWMAENAAEYIDVFSSHNYQDFITKYDENAVNDNAVILPIPGSRVQQNVKLEPNCNYTLTFKVKLNVADRLTTSGYIAFGAWDADKVNETTCYIEAGGQPTFRLNLGSVKVIDHTELPEGVSDISMTFNSGDKDKGIVGIFSDIKEKNTVLKLFSASLVKENDDKNILTNSDFIKLSKCLLSSRDPIDLVDGFWRHNSAYKEFPSDPYWHLRECAKTAMKYIEKTGKPFWFDEYNVRAELQYFDHPLHATHRASNMQSLMNAGVQSSLMWTLFDQQWPNNHVNNSDGFVNGDHRHGVMPVLTRSLKPYPVYYSTGLIMKYMGGEPGTHIYEGIGKDYLHATVSKMPDGNISVLVINNKPKADAFTVDFGEKLGVKLNRRLYDPATIVPDETAKQIKADKDFDVENTLSDSLPANAVAVYTTIVD